MLAVPAAWAHAGFTRDVSILNYGQFARPADARSGAALLPTAALAYDDP